MLNKLLQENYRKLNTLTKYPSILTYHELGKKGTLKEELTQNEIEVSNIEELEGTEKVDGTNVRIIICGEDYIIGTREDLIYAKGDRIVNDQLSILEKCIPIAEDLVKKCDVSRDEILVVYGENYGKNIGRNYKNYSTQGNVGFRVFDVWEMKISEVCKLFDEYDLSRLSTWREHNNQPFYNVYDLEMFVQEYNLERTPILFKIKIEELPTTIEEMYDFISKYKNTIVGLDAHGKSEGIVVRSKDRKFIKKIRIEEYEKTMK